MKTTLDIPDALYREFKAKTATNGEKVRNAVIAVMVAYTAGEWAGPAARPRPARAKRRQMAMPPKWAGMAAPFITKYPDAPLDGERMRDEIVAARRVGLK